MASSKHLHRIRKVSVVDQVCVEIKQNIVDGIWKENSKLPSESDLAEIYGVNRLSVRMALQKLNTLGIVETRAGMGTYVRKFSLPSLIHEVVDLYAENQSEKDIKQFRNLIECDSMRLAMIYGTDEELAELKHRKDQYYHNANIYAADMGNEEKLDALVDSDLNFHTQVVAMSHNQIYLEIYSMVRSMVRQNIKDLLYVRMHNRVRNGEQLVTIDDTHEKIYEAISQKDYGKSRQLTYDMLTGVSQGEEKLKTGRMSSGKEETKKEEAEKEEAANEEKQEAASSQ